MNELEEIKKSEGLTGTVKRAAETLPHPIDEIRQHLQSARAVHGDDTTQDLHNKLQDTGAVVTGPETPIQHEGLLNEKQFKKPSGNTSEASTWSDTQAEKHKEQEAIK